MVHHEVALGSLAFDLVPGGKGRPDRAAGVTAGRLHIDLLEWRALEDLAVGDRVVGAAAGQHDGVGVVALMQRAQKVEESVLVGRLRRARDVAMLVLERRRRIARRPEQLAQRIAPQPAARGDAVLHRVVGALARCVAEKAQVEGEGAVVVQLHDLTHGIELARLAIRGEAHHLVFVAIVREADELRHRLVEHAERVREVDAAIDGEFAALTQSPGGGGEIDDAVDRHRHRLVVGRHQKGRGEMAEMMLDGMDAAAELLAGQLAREISRDVGAVAAMAQALQHIGRTDARGQHIGELAPAISPVVAVHRDMRHIAERDAGFGEAIADRFAGEAAPMLDAPKALLLDGSDEIAVLHEASSSVGVIGVKAEDVAHFLPSAFSRSRCSRCMERIRSAVTRCAV